MAALLYSRSLSRSCDVVCADDAESAGVFVRSIAGNPACFSCAFNSVTSLDFICSQLESCSQAPSPNLRTWQPAA